LCLESRGGSAAEDALSEIVGPLVHVDRAGLISNATCLPTRYSPRTRGKVVQHARSGQTLISHPIILPQQIPFDLFIRMQTLKIRLDVRRVKLPSQRGVPLAQSSDS
jgi:hypothetical protein